VQVIKALQPPAAELLQVVNALKQLCVWVSQQVSQHDLVLKSVDLYKGMLARAKTALQVWLCGPVWICHSIILWFWLQDAHAWLGQLCDVSTMLQRLLEDGQDGKEGAMNADGCCSTLVSILNRLKAIYSGFSNLEQHWHANDKVFGGTCLDELKSAAQHYQVR
jgi:hypothetical protein